MITEKDFKRINGDIYGNPRYVFHYLHLITSEEIEEGTVNSHYQKALRRAKNINGRKFHNKQYGGGIVITTYSIEKEIQKINTLMETVRDNNEDGGR